MNKVIVTCTDKSRYENEIEDGDRIEITGHGEVSWTQEGCESIVIRLPSPGGVGGVRGDRVVIPLDSTRSKNPRRGKQLPLVKPTRHEMERSMPPICRWCDRSATTERTVIPEDINARTKEVRHAAVTAEVCAEHAAMIDREFRCRELEKEIHKLDLKLRRTDPKEEKKHKPLVTKRAALREELLTLQGRPVAA